METVLHNKRLKEYECLIGITLKIYEVMNTEVK